MSWKEEFIKLLEARTFKTNSEIDNYADEHNLPAADVWRCFAKYRDDCLIKQSIGTPCEGCRYVAQIDGPTSPCYECCRNKTDFYERDQLNKVLDESNMFYSRRFLEMTKNRDKRYPVAIDDLLIEFDEMDYCPMNLSGGDPVKEAIAWKDRLRYELDLLLDEKSAIERRAVEEFAQKIKEKALSHCKIINCYELTFIEETINELLKDYEK